jgi:hypothetical protein
VVAEIQTYSMSVIEHCYREFLFRNHDTDEREYADAADQIREVLIHGNYLSRKAHEGRFPARATGMAVQARPIGVLLKWFALASPLAKIS